MTVHRPRCCGINVEEEFCSKSSTGPGGRIGSFLMDGFIWWKHLSVIVMRGTDAQWVVIKVVSFVWWKHAGSRPCAGIAELCPTVASADALLTIIADNQASARALHEYVSTRLLGTRRLPTIH
jgi:hypothetical protein